MARAAGASTSPSASIGNGSAGGNSRISGRGRSSLTSTAFSTITRTRAAPAVSDRHMLHPIDYSVGTSDQNIVEIETERWLRNPDAPSLRDPSTCGILSCGFAWLIAVGKYDYIADLCGQIEVAQSRCRERRPR